jgi:hypothetical protein
MDTLTVDQQKLADNTNVPVGQAGSPWTLPNSTVTAPAVTNFNDIQKGIPTSTLVQPSLSFPHPPQPSSTDAFISSLDPLLKQSQSDYQSIYGATETQQQQQLETERTGYISSLKDLFGKLAGKTDAFKAAEQKYGVDDSIKKLQELNLMIAQRTGEYDKAIQGREGQAIPIEFITGQQAAIQRQKAVEIGALAAQQQALQGNLQLSEQLAERTVNLQFEPIEQQIKATQAFLDLNSDSLSREEKKQATAMQYMLTQKQAQLDQQKELRTEFIKSGVDTQFVTVNGTVTRTSDGYMFHDQQEAAAAGVQFDATGRVLNAPQFVSSSLQQQQFDNSLKLGQLGLQQDQLNLDAAKAGATMNPDGSFNIVQTPEGFTLGENQTRYDGNGNPIAGAGVNAQQSNPQEQAQTKANIDLISGLLGRENFANAVAPSAIGRWNIANMFTGEKSNVISTVEQLTSQLTLDSLVRAKAQGATFGALSEGELRTLAASATKIGTWAIKKDGNVVGYKTTEPEFRKELDKINNFAKLDYVLKGGNPQDVGAVQMPDGTIWTSNSDGSKTQLLDKAPFNSAGKPEASTGNQVKGMMQKASPLPLLNMDGNPKTPNVPLTKAYPPNSYGGQCGVWVRQIVEKQGLTYPRVGDSLAEKMATVKKYGSPITKAKLGSVLITKENKTTGHVAYIVGANKSGFILAESNYGLNGKVSYGRIIPFNSPNIIGIINPTRG